MSPAKRDDGSEGMGGLDRAAAILGAFDATHRELTLAALVTRSGLPRSTTHRVADRLFKISSLAPIRHELREAALPFLQDLHAAAKTTVQLGVLEGGQVLVVERITGHRPMPMLEQAGGKIPAHCSALGRAILAYSAPETIEAILGAGLQPRTPRTLTSRTAVLRELTAIPPRGWAVDREEGNIGISCVAAPVFGPLGQVAAALSVTGPTGLVRPERIGPGVRLGGGGGPAG